MRLLSKANLEVQRVASKDPLGRALCGVKIEKDGTTVAGNGNVMMAVGPVTYAEKIHFPENAGEELVIGETGLLMPKESVDRALRFMSKEKKIHLQHVAIIQVKDRNRVGFVSVDSKGDPTVNAALPRTEKYHDWKGTLRKLKDKDAVEVCLNRKDLIHLLQALEAACPDHGGYSPVFLEIGKGGNGIIARCINLETQQHALGALTAYDTAGQWLTKDNWERMIFGIKKAVKKVMKRRKVK